jgi:hypothetical protein
MEAQNILGILPVEVRDLLRDYRVIQHNWQGQPGEVDADASEVSLGDSGGPRRTEPLPSGDDLRLKWKARYPDLASTDHLVAMLPGLRETLLEACSKLTCDYPRGRLSKADKGEACAALQPVRRAVSAYARFLWALSSLRSMICHETGKTDHYSAYETGGATMRDPRYRPYNRLLGKVGRSNPKFIAKRRERDAKPENQRARNEWKATKRATDPAYRAAENKKRRDRYALKKQLATMLEQV